ncbi:MAG: hypothetical protein VX938_04735, partial [Myxococcota bacterium]|nr:hypothetical protein [Myxococcota bacterium]
MNRHLLPIYAAALLWAHGCASEEPPPTTPEIVSDVVEDVPQAPDDITEDTAVEEDVTPEVVEPEFTYTYHRDVKPIFETLCVNCHQP